MKRIFLAAGEASGDEQASLLARALRARRSDLEICGVGSDRMASAGVRLVARSEELAVVGILEVAGRLPRILAALDAVRSALGELRPDLFVPVDFPDFNFRLLPRAFRLGVPIVYYISPQLWAWRPGRVHVLRRYLRRMITIFPFEAAFYREAGVPVTWVGHPYVDRIPPAAAPEEERARLGLPAGGPVVALLPGSRRSEIERIAPLLQSVRREVDGRRGAAGLVPVRWLAGRAPGLEVADVRLDGIDARFTGLEALRAADLAIAASGTATLEAALLGRPLVVVYRVHPLTWEIARRSVRVPHIAMANLLAGRRVVPEFVQDAATPAAVAGETMRLLESPLERATMQAGLAEARASLGPPGAADRAAEILLREMDGGGR
jgi:lipid-A-disaccharide synthase